MIDMAENQTAIHRCELNPILIPNSGKIRYWLANATHIPTVILVMLSVKLLAFDCISIPF